MIKRLFTYFFTFFLMSCSYFQPAVMFKEKRDFQFDELTEEQKTEYVISVNDILDFEIFTKDGYRLIDVAGDARYAKEYIKKDIRYIVELDGTVKLPVIGKFKIAGLRIKEAEKKLEERYAEYYNNPFIVLNINNRRVVVFAGKQGSATVVPLVNENITLAEVLAGAGGLSEYGRAKKIKILRESGDSLKVFNLDLRNIENAHLIKTTMQANDIVYVTPQFNISIELLQELTPLLALFTSALIALQFVR